MTRIKLGWRLAKDSWAVLAADRSLAIFPVISFVTGTVAFVLLIAPGIVVSEVLDQDWLVIPFALVAAYGFTFATIYFNVALAGAASLSIDGRNTTLADGMAVASKRRGQIARWAVVQVVVGILIQTIEEVLGSSVVGRAAAALVSAILGAAWALATFFVVPVLAFEGVTPGAAFKRSAGLIRQRWGEGVVGSASIALAVTLVAIPPVFVLMSVSASTPGALSGVAVLLAMLVVVAAVVAGSALSVIFRVSLYRYATAGEPAGPFDEADLAGAFRPR